MVPGSRALVGHCVNLLPVRSRCTDDLAFNTYLKTLKGDVLDGLDHQELTFGRLVQLLNVPRDSGRVPLVPVVFNLDRAPAGFELEGLVTHVEELWRPALVFDLAINVIDNDRDLRLDCDFNTDLFDAATIERWMGHFRTLLMAAVASPACLVGDLPLLSQVERRDLIERFNLVTPASSSHRLPRDGGTTLHALFEAQAAACSDTVALVCDEKPLTYGQLNAEANRLARRLVRNGVGPNTLVGLCLERSNELVIALLAILKAGGAYLPIDLGISGGAPGVHVGGRASACPPDGEPSGRKPTRHARTSYLRG